METASKRAIQNIEEATGALIGNELQKSQNFHHEIFQRQLQMSIIKKYLRMTYLSRKKKKIIDEFTLI